MFPCGSTPPPTATKNARQAEPKVKGMASENFPSGLLGVIVEHFYF